MGDARDGNSHFEVVYYIIMDIANTFLFPI